MKVRWIAVVLALSVAGSLRAAVVMKVETRDHSQSPPRTQMTSIAADGRLLKMSIPPTANRAGGDVIFRGERREMIIVNHSTKSYVVIDAATLKRLSAQINQAKSQAQEALANVPERERGLVSKLASAQTPSPRARSQPQVRLLGDRATVFGYPAVRFEMIRDGHKIRELWATEWGNIDGGREVAQAFKEMAAFTGEMTEAFSAGGGTATSTFDDGVTAALRSIDGFPVGVRDYRDDGSLETESALRSARQQRIDPAEFEPPAGYKRQAMFRQ